jgi:hypothetical protein
VPVERMVDVEVEYYVDNPIYYDTIQEVDIDDIDLYQADGYLPTQFRVMEEEV